IGARQYVFLVTDQPGVFAQREVTTGPEANGTVPIYSGLTGGERVVTEGSFLLRAESIKQNPALLTTPATPSTPQVTRPEQPQASAPPAQQEPERKTQSVTVTLDEGGYKPASITLKKGVPARLTFIRKIEATCGTDILIPAYDIKRELPLNE